MLYPCTGVWFDAHQGIPEAVLNSKRRELSGLKSRVCERLGEKTGSVNPARSSPLGSERPVPSQQAAWSRVSRSGSGIRRLGVAAHSRTGNGAWRGRVQSCPVEPDDFGKRPLLDLLDAMVEERSRPQRAWGRNYSTPSNCCDSRQVSRRMQQAPVEFHEVRGPVDAAEYVGDDDVVGGRAEALERRVTGLEDLANELPRALPSIGPAGEPWSPAA